jgi:hypothetical protein
VPFVRYGLSRHRGRSLSETRTFTCDACGATKQAVNHWWIARTLQKGGFILHPWILPEELYDNDHIGHILDRPEVCGGLVHLCGQECVSKWSSKIIGGAQ